jgi:hypothetical protein
MDNDYRRPRPNLSTQARSTSPTASLAHLGRSRRPNAFHRPQSRRNWNDIANRQLPSVHQRRLFDGLSQQSEGRARRHDPVQISATTASNRLLDSPEDIPGRPAKPLVADGFNDERVIPRCRGIRLHVLTDPPRAATELLGAEERPYRRLVRTRVRIGADNLAAEGANTDRVCEAPHLESVHATSARTRS